jgi:hypothetical protein
MDQTVPEGRFRLTASSGGIRTDEGKPSARWIGTISSQVCCKWREEPDMGLGLVLLLIITLLLIGALPGY